MAVEPAHRASITAPDDAAYRPVSAWAVVGLVAGIASAVTLLVDSPMAWLVPVVAVVACGLGLYETRTTSQKAGRRLAVCGVLLAVAFLAGGVTRRELRRHWAADEARSHAQAWIEHLRHGRRRAAHQMSLPLAARCAGDQTLSQCYRSRADLQEQLDKYVGEPPVRMMLLWGEQADYRVVDVPLVDVAAGVDLVVIIYEVALPTKDTAAVEPPRYLRLLCERSHDWRLGQSSWRVVRGNLSSTAHDASTL